MVNGGGAMLMTGLDDVEGLFQPQQFCDCMNSVSLS